MQVLFFRDEAEVLRFGNIDRRQTLDGGIRIPVKLELQMYRELPEGRHGLYSAPSWFILSETLAVML